MPEKNQRMQPCTWGHVSKVKDDNYDELMQIIMTIMEKGMMRAAMIKNIFHLGGESRAPTTTYVQEENSKNLTKNPTTCNF